MCVASVYALFVMIQTNRETASADRRPVDPPPIVELRVYEGEGAALQDITFSYNANFFLFATLENARVVAQGRVPPGPTTFPVLTGTPVAGMAYLDRPQPAGYFIFPDLSVRHEGRYRLSFALYEELKEARDMDPEDRQNLEIARLGGNEAHVSHRLEVKSAPFTVFSAKKFPGLTESTALSRMVAEQGCRVRIRRDVRMRRRDTKSNKEWDDEYDETAYERARRTATPDAYSQQNMPTPQPIADGSDRPRSVSNASNASFAPPQRRPSMQDMASSYQQGYPPQMAPQQPQNGYQTMQYSQPPAHTYPAQYSQPQGMMQPPQAPYQPAQQHTFQPPPQPQGQMHMSNGYGYTAAPTYSQPAYDQQNHVRHESMDYSNSPDYRRHTITQPPPAQYPNAGTMMNHYGAMEQQKPMQPVQPVQPTSTSPTSAHPMHSQSLAPLKTLQPVAEKIEPASPLYATPNGMSASSADSARNGHFFDKGAPPKYQPQANGATKRTFSDSFDTAHLNEPLRHGARPNVPAHSIDEYIPYGGDEGDEEVLDERAMSYRRADGSQRLRRMPLSGECE
jgi:hypothetical protein